MKKIIINGTVVLKDALLKTNVLINDDIIEGFSNDIKEGYEVIDAKGAYVAPGFVDVHTHGRNKCDTMDGTYESIDTISVNCMKTGVTSVCPTTMTQSVELTRQAIQNCADYMGKENGAKIVGVHMEGPFIEIKKKGAQPGEYVVPASIETYEAMVNGNDHAIALMSLAAELEGGHEFTHYLVSKGVTASLGHTGANYEQAKEAFRHGVNHATHTYNAMSGFTHREPGVVGAVFDTDHVYAELILDGIHVHFAAAKTLIKEKGIEKVCLITDSMEASGLPDGEYALGGQPVYVKNGEARLFDGTLAGSVLKMNEGVRNAYHELHLPLYDAVRMASYNPAMSINHPEIGDIAQLKKADILFINDNIDILGVMINGKEMM